MSDEQIRKAKAAILAREEAKTQELPRKKTIENLLRESGDTHIPYDPDNLIDLSNINDANMDLEAEAEAERLFAEMELIAEKRREQDEADERKKFREREKIELERQRTSEQRAKLAEQEAREALEIKRSRSDQIRKEMEIEEMRERREQEMKRREMQLNNPDQHVDEQPIVTPKSTTGLKWNMAPDVDSLVTNAPLPTPKR
jgi:hypothetical protein